MSFQAKIKLGLVKAAALTHTGFKGRVIKKGESFTSTNQEEAMYYRAQPGFSVTVLKGKLPAPTEPDDEPEVDESGDDEVADEEAVEEEREEAVDGGYERADLKKMSRDDLLALIKSDDDLPLTVREVPKKASKKEIINLILDAQKASESDEEDDD